MIPTPREYQRRDFQPGDCILTAEGRPGVVVRIEGDLVIVRWDSDDEFNYAYHVADGWIMPR